MDPKDRINGELQSAAVNYVENTRCDCRSGPRYSYRCWHCVFESVLAELDAAMPLAAGA